MQPPLKRERYALLVDERKQCRLCEESGLRNPADANLAVFDSDQIGPWTRLHGDLNAQLMVIGQDWGGVPYYRDNEGLDCLNNPTMQALECLFRSIGLDVSLSAYGAEPRGLFLTNAVLCLKQGGLQAPVNPNWFANCAPRFLRRQIEIVSPLVAVGLGQRAYDAVKAAFGLDSEPLAHAVQSTTGTVLPNGTRLLAVYHCGNRTRNINRSMEQQIQDWQRVATALGLAGTT